MDLRIRGWQPTQTHCHETIDGKAVAAGGKAGRQTTTNGNGLIGLSRGLHGTHGMLGDLTDRHGSTGSGVLVGNLGGQRVLIGITGMRDNL